MGCTESTNEIDTELTLQDYVWKSQSTSKNSVLLNNFKNYFGYLSLNELVQILTSPEKEKSIDESRSYWDEVAVYKFSIILKKKILEHPLLENTYENNQEEANTFVEIFLKLLEFVSTVFRKPLYSDIFGKKFPKNEIKTVVKLSILPIAFLYCGHTSNRTKLSYFFNLLSDNGKLSMSNDLRIFLLMLIYIPTNLTCISMYEASANCRSLEKDKDEFLKMYDVYSKDDCFRASQRFLDKLFGTENPNSVSYSFQEFEDVFNKNQLNYIFSVEGIRMDLDENNNK